MHDWIVTDVLAVVQSEYLEGGCEDDKVRVRVLRSDAYFFAEMFFAERRPYLEFVQRGNF